MFDIYATIKKIRKQPEHIRLRWVYGSVFVCMVFVLFIWTLSLKINFGAVEQPQEMIDVMQESFVTATQNQQPSLQDLTTNDNE